MKNPIDPEQMKLWFLGTFAIIISAMKIPFRNPNFITFTLITSIPLFFIMLIPRLLHIQDPLINLFIEALEKRKILTYTSTFATIKTSRAVEPITQFPKVYMDDLVNFLTALATIYASSTIHTSNGDHEASMGLRDLLKSSISKSRWRDGLFTFIAMSMLYNICLPYVSYCIHVQQLHLSGFRDSLILKIVHVVVPAVTFSIWVEYNAWWKLSVVVSVLELEEQRGFQAFSISSQLMKGNKLRGFVLMLLLRSSDWPTILRGQSSNLPTLLRGQSFYVPSTDIAHIFLHAGLLCLGKVLTWMVFTVYYFDCKSRRQKRPFYSLVL